MPFRHWSKHSNVARFVFDSIGCELSTRRIAGTLTSDGRKSDSRTIERYLDALLESFLIYKAERYDVKGKQLLKTLEKYYVVGSWPPPTSPVRAFTGCRPCP